LKKSLSAKKYMISAKKADLYPSFFLLVKGDLMLLVEKNGTTHILMTNTTAQALE